MFIEQLEPTSVLEGFVERGAVERRFVHQLVGQAIQPFALGLAPAVQGLMPLARGFLLDWGRVLRLQKRKSRAMRGF
ncbi:hypothetical protein [Metapseudomonas resinovorans]|uniref:hypothetical protein n=1 Tax=Metapseudomonas resinovorans TaxID=53412 RepID=UPI00237F3815|nr:hypothetical protein [Pseudomonas resinovorans]